MNTTPKQTNRNGANAQKRVIAIQALIVSRRLRAYARLRAPASSSRGTSR